VLETQQFEMISEGAGGLTQEGKKEKKQKRPTNTKRRK
jgi:hypothetical protein